MPPTGKSSRPADSMLLINALHMHMYMILCMCVGVCGSLSRSVVKAASQLICIQYVCCIYHAQYVRSQCEDIRWEVYSIIFVIFYFLLVLYLYLSTLHIYIYMDCIYAIYSNDVRYQRILYIFRVPYKYHVYIPTYCMVLIYTPFSQHFDNNNNNSNLFISLFP